MIRVNLLPVKQARRRSEGRKRLIIFVAAIFLEVAVLATIYLAISEDLAEQERLVSQHRQAVNQAQAAVRDVASLQQQAQQLKQQLDVLKELEENRIGPVRVLDELQAILSPPRHEEDRYSQGERRWNVEWDPRRVWLTSFSEQSGRFELEGMAVNADDVAEFLQRLTTATHFGNVKLDIWEVASNQRGSSAARTVRFLMNGEVYYNPESE